MSDLDKSANRAMWLAIAGLFTCCAPLGVGALVWAFLIKRDADATNAIVPVRAWIALALGGLCVVEMTGAILYSRKKEGERAAVAAAAVERLKGRRETLDAAIACDLVTEFVIGTEKRAYDTVRCPGELTQQERSASLNRVLLTGTAGDIEMRACFGKTSRWFVVGVDKELSCPTEIPSAVAPPGDEAAQSAEERRLRVAIAEQTDAKALSVFTERMQKARSVLAAHAHVAKTCPAFPGEPSNRTEIGYVDFDYLNAPVDRPNGAWTFLTKRAVKEALQKGATGRSVKDFAGVLAVFSAESRAWPESVKKEGLIKDDFSFIPGRFEGWLTLFDLEKSAVLCEARFVFENSDNVRYRKGKFSSEEGSVDKALRTDFEDRFEEAAIAAIRALSNNRLKLGVKLLE